MALQSGTVINHDNRNVVCNNIQIEECEGKDFMNQCKLVKTFTNNNCIETPWPLYETDPSKWHHFKSFPISPDNASWNLKIQNGCFNMNLDSKIWSMDCAHQEQQFTKTYKWRDLEILTLLRQELYGFQKNSQKNSQEASNQLIVKKSC